MCNRANRRDRARTAGRLIILAVVLIHLGGAAALHAQDAALRVRVPPSSSQTCAPDSLYFCAKVHGVPDIHLAQVRQLLPVGYHGVTAAQLLDAAGSVGLRFTGLHVPSRDLRLVGAPAILHVNGNHFVVYLGHEKDRMVLFDNTIGLLDCNSEWFWRRYQWSGVALASSSSQGMDQTIQTLAWALLTLSAPFLAFGGVCAARRWVARRPTEMPTADPAATRPGFSLIELLVVVAIFGVLVGLTLAAVQRARAAAEGAKCRNNLRQIGIALHGYDAAKGMLPPGASYRNGSDPEPFMSWCTRLLPHLDQLSLWQSAQQAYTGERDFRINPPHVGFSTVLPVFVCPADARTAKPFPVGRLRPALLSYLGLEGVNQFRQNGVLFLDSRVRLSDISDGTSQSLMVGERPPSADGVFGWWYAGKGQDQDGSADMVLGVREQNIDGPYAYGCSRKPYEFVPGRIDNQCDAFHFWSLHHAGAHFLFADGSLRLLRYSANPIMPALATRAGGEAIALPD